MRKGPSEYDYKGRIQLSRRGQRRPRRGMTVAFVFQLIAADFLADGGAQMAMDAATSCGLVRSRCCAGMVMASPTL